ncbi:hypothetical protein FRC03_012617 [Tulasnella sp. 419]|nr:hypothetical protein FRC03_012617 [Tulasnella sp. 419]
MIFTPSQFLTLFALALSVGAQHTSSATHPLTTVVGTQTMHPVTSTSRGPVTTNQALTSWIYFDGNVTTQVIVPVSQDYPVTTSLPVSVYTSSATFWPGNATQISVPAPSVTTSRIQNTPTTQSSAEVTGTLAAQNNAPNGAAARMAGTGMAAIAIGVVGAVAGLY